MNVGVRREDLPQLVVAPRLGALQREMQERGLAGYVVAAPSNIRYLTGFTGSAGSLFVAVDGAWLVTDGRYTVQAARQLEQAGLVDDAASGCALVIDSNGERALGDLIAAAISPTASVGLEADHVSWSRAVSAQGAWDRDVDAVSGLVEDLRVVKDPGEVGRIAAACAIADDALASIWTEVRPGRSERGIADSLDAAMRARGSDGPSFETIVASGPNSALPHARPSERLVEHGDAVVIDFGATVDGYHSDMTRTVLVGGGTPQLRSIWELVATAQRAGCSASRSGVAAASVDSACRSLIDDGGYGAQFSHGTGHGVGLDIHESPRVASTSTATLAAGHIVTVEPGIYVEGLGGVRIEDTLHVLDDGAAILTTTPISMAVG